MRPRRSRCMYSIANIRDKGSWKDLFVLSLILLGAFVTVIYRECLLDLDSIGCRML
jgi:hypothetical protein